MIRAVKTKMLHPNAARKSAARVLSLSIALLIAAAPLAAQNQQPAAPQQQGMGGVSTGEAKTYTTKRTFGIVDPKAPVVFEDVTARTGLSSFQHRSGSPQKDYIVETPSGGVAIFDYDGDSQPDIYLVNGSTFAAL